MNARIRSQTTKVLLSREQAYEEFQTLSMLHYPVCGFITPSLEENLKIRFVFEKILRSQNGKDLLFLSSIAKSGLERLGKHTGLEVSIILNDRTYQFHCVIGKEYRDGMLLKFPNEVYSVNNRKERRVHIPLGYSVFFHPKEFEYDYKDISAPPIFGFYQDVSAWQRVVDLSKTGMMVESRFPNFLKWAEEVRFIAYGAIIFPDNREIPISAEISWAKRIREKLQDETESEGERKYRCGFSLTFYSEVHTNSYNDLLYRLASGQLG